MGWLARLFGAAPKEEMEGVHLDTRQPCWEVDSPTTFSAVLRALRGWLPEDAILYIEGGSPGAQIGDFLTAHSVPERAHLAMGTIWPRPKVFHVPASPTTLTELAEVMEHHAAPAIHFHVYRDRTILLQWYDAFCDPILLIGSIPEDQVRVFADRVGETFRRRDGATRRS